MGSRALPGLKTVLDRGEYWEKKSAIEALCLIRGEKAGRLLKSVLRGGEWRIKKTAINLLAGKELGWLDKELEKLAKDPDLNVSYSALGALRKRRRGFSPPIKRKLPDNFGNRKHSEKRIVDQ